MSRTSIGIGGRSSGSGSSGSSGSGGRGSSSSSSSASSSPTGPPYSLGMDARMTACIWNTNFIMV